MLEKILLIFLIAFIIYPSYGQSRDENHQGGVKKNALQVSAGFSGFRGGYNVTYERLIVSFEKNSLMGLWAKGGFGGWGVIYSTGGPYQHLSLGILTGKNKGHFELNFGGARMYNKTGLEHETALRDHHSEPKPTKDDYVDFSPIGAMGYRYQKPSGNFLFRCGVGYPESIYIGFGLGF
jgi:hypothetical protein